MNLGFFNLLMNGAQSTPHPGYIYLTQNGRAFYDFTAMAGAADSIITSVADLSPNGCTLEGNGSPVIKNKQIDGVTYKTAETYIDSNPTRRVLQLANAAHSQGWFRSSFEIFCTFMIEDGQPTTVLTQNYFGMYSKATNKNQVQFRQNYSAPNYFLGSFYTSDDALFASYGWSTLNGNPFIDGPMGQTLVRIKFDFENDVFLMHVNGLGGTYTVFTNITNVVNPSSFDANGIKFCIGSVNSLGTILAQATCRMNWLRFAVTPILTAQEAVDVSDYLLL